MSRKKPSLAGLAKRNAPKRLFIDIETSLNVVYSWRVGYKIALGYENIIKERAIICIGYKWSGGKVKCLRWDNGDDAAMLRQFIPILESADEVVAHWGDKFDLPWLRARTAFHGIPVSPYIKTIDTCAQSRRLFYFNSHKLDYLAQFLGLGTKIDTDFDLWKRATAGNKTALREMCTYCKGDVELLERVYLRLQSYNRPKTHQGVVRGEACSSCPQCGATDVIRIGQKVSGTGTIQPRMRCKACQRDFLVSAAELRRHYKCRRVE